MKGPEPKYQRMLDEMMGAAGMTTKGVELYDAAQAMQVVDVTETAASPETGAQVVQVMSNGLEVV